MSVTLTQAFFRGRTQESCHAGSMSKKLLNFFRNFQRLSALQKHGFDPVGASVCFSEERSAQRSHSKHSDSECRNAGFPDCLQIPTKPPNIVVYAGESSSSDDAASNQIRDVLQRCLLEDTYTISGLTHDDITAVPWVENSVLLVSTTVGGDADDKLALEIERFMDTGGKFLFIGKQETQDLQDSLTAKDALESDLSLGDLSIADGDLWLIPEDLEVVDSGIKDDINCFVFGKSSCKAAAIFCDDASKVGAEIVRTVLDKLGLKVVRDTGQLEQLPALTPGYLFCLRQVGLCGNYSFLTVPSS